MIPILAKSIENLTDARYFASWQADWIALSAEQGGKPILDMTAIKEIVSWLDGSQLMLSFDQTPLDEAIWMTREAGLQAILLPYQALSVDPELELFMSIDIRDEALAAVQVSTSFRHGAHVVLNTDHWTPQTESFLAAVLPTPFLRKKCFLDIPLNEELVRQLDETLPGVGFCLSGSQEERPGYKAFDELDEIVEVLRPWD